MTRKRYVLFALLSVTLAVSLSTVVILAGDIYLHQKFAESAAVNVWGYRGPVVRSKQPNEWRVAVLGGSTAFGYGVLWHEAFPAVLQDLLNAPAHSTGRPMTVVNLAYNAEGAHSYKFTLRDYEYLEYDAVLFYSGYNDLGGPNLQVFRQTSPIFRLTGYLPIYPVIFSEKAMAIRYGGRLDDAYRGRKTVFRPNIAQRATASALETAVSISRSLETQLGRGLPDSTVEASNGEGAPCGQSWAHYCGAIYEAVKLALDRKKKVLMVTQPYISASHVDQQEHLVDFLRQRFSGARGLSFANLGDAVSLKDPALAYDGIHLTTEGNRVIATALVPHVRRLLQ